MSQTNVSNESSPINIEFVSASELPDTSFSSIANLTFPSHHLVLKQGLEGAPDVFAVVAQSGNEIIGLVLCTLEENTSGQLEADLLSIAIAAKYRGQGIAGKLLENLESRLKGSGVVKLQTTFTSASSAYQQLVRILASRGWDELTPRILFNRGSVQRVFDEAPWLDRIVCPEEFEVFDWGELTVSERARLEAGIEGGDIPIELSPFYREDILELANSVGVRFEGRVIGWQVNHPVDGEPGVLRYSRTFVYPEFQRTGRGIILIKESILRHVDRILDKYPNFLSDVAYERPAMVRFYKRHLIPYGQKSYSSFRSQKVIV